MFDIVSTNQRKENFKDKCNVHSKTIMAVVSVDVSRVFTHKLLRSGYKLNSFTKYFEHRILIKQKVVASFFQRQRILAERDLVTGSGVYIKI